MAGWDSPPCRKRIVQRQGALSERCWPPALPLPKASLRALVNPVGNAFRHDRRSVKTLALGRGSNHYAPEMNSKAPVVILVVLCLGLLAALVVRHNKAANEKRTDLQRIQQLSNEWATARAKLDDLEAVNASLRSDRDSARANLDRTAAQLAQLRETLAETERRVQEAAKVLEEKTAALARLEIRARELESENSGLEKQAVEMRQTISALETQIADTRRRLANAEGDRDYLLGELLRLQREKSSLERRLSDITSLREQIARIRAELTESRRLDDLRRQLYGPEPLKGGELLQRGVRRELPPGKRPDLDVEIRRDGAPTIVTPPPNP